MGWSIFSSNSGNQTKQGIILGNKVLEDEELASLLNGIGPGAQVNAIIRRLNCDSGRPAKAMQNDTRISPISKRQEQPVITSEILDFTSALSIRPATQRFLICRPRRKYGKWKHDILFRDYADVNHPQPQRTSNREHNKRPSLANIANDIFSFSSARAPLAAKNAAGALVTASTSLCNENSKIFMTRRSLTVYTTSNN